MNCKQGDLALIIDPDNFGKNVVCQAFIGGAAIPGTGVKTTYNDVWEVDTPVLWRLVGTDVVHRIPYCPDRYLMPLSGYKPLKEELGVKLRSDIRPMTPDEHNLMLIALWRSVDIVHRGYKVDD